MVTVVHKQLPKLQILFGLSYAEDLVEVQIFETLS